MFHSSCRMAGLSGGNFRGFTSLWIVLERPAIGNKQTMAVDLIFHRGWLGSHYAAKY
jgi:hypothetical protein